MGRDYRLEFKNGIEKERLVKFSKGPELAVKELAEAVGDGGGSSF